MEEWLSPREIAIQEMNSLRGRLCTVIESMGLDTKQERASVSLIKNLSYQNQAVIAELISRLEDKIEELEAEQNMGGNPVISFRYTTNKLE